jgi:predicted Zn-dependent protease with MMP-like domain
MQPRDLTAPSLADIERLAEQAWEALPPRFRTPCEGLLIRVADWAEEETPDEMGIEDPLELTGRDRTRKGPLRGALLTWVDRNRFDLIRWRSKRAPMERPPSCNPTNRQELIRCR